MKEPSEKTTAIAEFRPFESRMLEFRRRYADVSDDLLAVAISGPDGEEIGAAVSRIMKSIQGGNIRHLIIDYSDSCSG